MNTLLRVSRNDRNAVIDIVYFNEYIEYTI